MRLSETIDKYTLLQNPAQRSVFIYSPIQIIFLSSCAMSGHVLEINLQTSLDGGLYL